MIVEGDYDGFFQGLWSFTSVTFQVVGNLSANLPTWSPAQPFTHMITPTTPKISLVTSKGVSYGTTSVVNL